MTKKTFFSLALFALALTAIVIQYNGGHPIQKFLFNSDGLYLPTLFADLFQHGGKLKDWYLTPAPYIFPDYFLYAIAYVSSDGAFKQLLVFGLLQLTVMTVIVGLIARACVRDHGVSVAILMGTGMAWLAMQLIEPYLYVLISAYHYGAFLAALAFVALWLHREQKQYLHDWPLACMCIIGFLGALSDTLFMVQTIAPFLLTCMLVRRQDRPFIRASLWPGIVLAVALAGSLSYRWIVAYNTRYPNALGLNNFALNLREMVQVFATEVQKLPILGVVLAIYIILSIVCIARVLAAKGFLRLPRPLLLLLVFSFIAACGNLLAMLLTTNLVITTRYMIPAMSWPLVVMTILVAHWSAKRFTIIAFAGSFLFVFGAAVASFHAPRLQSVAAYPADVACIDQALSQTGSRHGIAEYWDAKYIQSFSKHTLTIGQYMHDLSEHRWITSTRYFRPTYDFAIVNAENGPLYRLPQEAIIARNGPPLLTTVCGHHTVLAYAQDKLRVRKIVSPGDTYTWNGCELATQIGKPTASCILDKADPEAEGTLSFGPYEILQSGHYSFRLEYSSAKPATDRAGDWDLVLALPNEAKPVVAGVLTGSAGMPGEIKGTFTITPQESGNKVEFRTRSNKGGTMQVQSLTIARID